MASAVPGGVPCLIREVFFAPPCPEEVAKLFEVALVRHNNGDLEDAINTYLQAQAVWEGHILATEYSDLEDATASSILATLVQRERELQEETLAKRDAELVEKARRDVELADRLQAEQEAAAVAAARAAELAGDSNAIPMKRFSAAGTGMDDISGGVAGGDEEQQQRYTKADLKRFQDDLVRRREKRDAERENELVKTKERQQRKMEAMFECPTKIPLEAHLFIQVAIGSVLETAGYDERALSTYLYALERAQQHLGSAASRHPVMATVHSCLGTVYFHIAQYDFAADHFFKALEIREELLPAGHVDIGATLNNIACVLHMLRRTSDALVFLYRAEEMFATQLDATHPRRDAVDRNIRKAKQSALRGVVPPPVPFQAGVVPPLIAGAKRAKEFFQAKPKKPKAKASK